MKTLTYQKQLEVCAAYDVAVVGSGPAGLCAAVADNLNHIRAGYMDLLTVKGHFVEYRSHRGIHFALLQSIKNRSVEKFSKGYAQTIANHFDGKKLGVLTFAIQDVFNTGGRQCGYTCQLVDADIMLTA